jgi:hypothetical protein
MVGIWRFGCLNKRDYKVSFLFGIIIMFIIKDDKYERT